MPTVPPFTTADPNSYVALGMQSALGTPQTAAAKLRFAKYISGNNVNVTPAVVDLREGGDGLDFGVSYKQKETCEGTLVFNLRPEIGGQFFQALPGGASWQSVSSAPASHMFHDNHASHPYMTMFVTYPGSSLEQLLWDVRFTGFTIEAQTGMPIKVTAPFMAINFGASFTDLTPTYYGAGSDGLGGNDDFWLFHTQPSVQFGGLADTTIERWTLSLKLGTEEIQAQSILLDDIPVLSREWDFSAERRYQSPSMYQAVMYGQGVAPTQSIATTNFRADYTYGTGVKKRDFTTIIGNLSMRDDNVTELDPDGKTVKETLSARPLHTATSAVTILLGNAHASAYGP